MLSTHFIPANQRESRRLLIMMHGLGDSYAGYLWLPDALDLPWLNYLLPNAPDNYFGGFSWFDFPGDIVPGVRRSTKLLFELLDQLHAKGFPTEQTVLGGFSQGGLMAIEVGARYPRRFAGVVCISGYVCEPEKLVRELSTVARQQLFLVTHGTFDPLIPIDLVRQQINLLKTAGLNIQWHELCKEHTIAGDSELDIIRNFICKCFETQKSQTAQQQLKQQLT